MKIEVKKVTETTETVEVEFPLYRKVVDNYVGSYYYCLISEKKYIEIWEGKRLRAIKDIELNCKEFIMLTESNESEFLEAYNRVQNELTINFHNTFSKDNEFIRTQSINSDQLD